MILRTKEKALAIKLREQGLSYSEIRKKISVSKSSLSLWLRSVGLAKRQQQRLSEKKKLSLERGWAKWHQTQVNRTTSLIIAAQKEVGGISNRELWLIGAMLYWAEGSKQKPHNISQKVAFSNSDPLMIKMFLRWLKDSLKLKDEDIIYELYLHETSRKRVAIVIEYWRKMIGNSIYKIPAYFKKGNIKTRRRNIGENYYGVLRIKVRRSTDLNRKISGWIQGVCNNCGVV